MNETISADFPLMIDIRGLSLFNNRKEESKMDIEKVK